MRQRKLCTGTGTVSGAWNFSSAASFQPFIHLSPSSAHGEQPHILAAALSPVSG